MRIADQRGPHRIGLGCLDAAERRREVGHVQGKELDGHVLAALFPDELLQPLAGDLAIVVVGRQDVVRLGVALFDHIVDQRIQFLPRDHAGAHVAAIAHAAFVQGIVEIQPLEALHDRPDDFARGTGDGTVDDVGLVADESLGRVLRIEPVAGLRVVETDLHLPAQQAARRINFVGRHGYRLDLLQAVVVQDAGLVQQVGHLDRLGRIDLRLREQIEAAGVCKHAGRGFDETPSIEGHGHSFVELPALALPASVDPTAAIRSGADTRRLAQAPARSGCLRCQSVIC
ncbi:hypothetical protein D9M68_605990 [compost metagenome]